MRVLLVPALILAALMCAAQSRPQTAERKTAANRAAEQRFEEDQKAIAQLQQQDIAASIAFDVEKLLALCTDDIVLLPPDHAPIKGKEALRTYYEQAEKTLGNTSILGYEENWDEVQISGDWAYQWGTIVQRLQAATGNKETTVSVHAMRILKREPDGLWLVARAIWNKLPETTAPTTAPVTPPATPAAKPPQ